MKPQFKELLYGQREIDALSCFEKGQTDPEALQYLADHFACRATFPELRNEAEALLKRIEKVGGRPNPNVGTKLTACLITKNEATYLDACLTALKGLVNEIVVVDTGSTDSTVAIAEKHGAVIGYFPWVDDFAAARNASLDLATSNWILWIDADEVLTPESHGSIREAITRPYYAGFQIPIHNFTDDEAVDEMFIHAPVRLFQNVPGLSFTGRIHEQVAPSLASLDLPYATLEQACILHYGYKPSVIEARGKAERALRMLEAELAEDHRNSFQWFNYANALALVWRFGEASLAARRAIQFADENATHVRHAYQLLMESLERDGDLDGSLKVAAELEEKGQGDVQSYFHCSSVWLALGNYSRALEYAKRCVAANWPVGQTGDYSIFTFKRHALLAKIYGLLEQPKEAEQALQPALKAAPTNPSVRLVHGAVLQALEKFIDARSVFTELYVQGAYQKEAAEALRNSYLIEEAWSEAAKWARKTWEAGVEDAEAWSNWAMLCEKAGDTPQLVEAFEAYAKYQLPSAEMLVDWGRAIAQTDPNKAMECFGEAMKRNPNLSNAYFNAGDLLYSAGQFMDAAHLFEQGLRIEPDFAQGWFVMGNALAQIGIDSGAELAYRRCLKLDPGHESAGHNLTVVAQAA